MADRGDATAKERSGPVLLIVLDGFGEGEPGPDNAISVAAPPFYLALRDEGLRTTIGTSGGCVGLPDGQMGNSEVGHLTIGAGRVVHQDISRIDRAIESGAFARNEALLTALARVEDSGACVHLLGLVSDGGVHSSDRHVAALLGVLGSRGLGPRTRIHAFLDGRDTPPKSAAGYLADLDGRCRAIGARIATTSGRYYAMDRDKRWERVASAWEAVVHGRGAAASDVTSAIGEAYDRGETDEFVAPTVVGEPEPIADGDLVLFFNFRADRARQLTEAFVVDAFDAFDRGERPKVGFATMTRYRDDFDVAELFGPVEMHDLFPELVSRAGMRQLRIAETEKYAHVTFFFGGGREELYTGEDRILVPSPKVATYDLEPEMSADEVTDRLVESVVKETFDFGVLNFANGDMVGHTGVMGAAVAAVHTLDRCLARIVPEIVKRRGVVALTADHGNCELMIDPLSKERHTAHTLNPVHFILVGDPVAQYRSLADGGSLADIAPTLLPFLGLEKPAAMDGRNLAS